MAARGRKSLNVSGKLSSGEKFTGVRELQNFLKENKEQAISCRLTQKLFVYGLKGGLISKDRVSGRRGHRNRKKKAQACGSDFQSNPK